MTDPTTTPQPEMTRRITTPEALAAEQTRLAEEHRISSEKARRFNEGKSSSYVEWMLSR